jgi:hypothetical protein
MDLDSMPEVERRRINALPAMIYHGVCTEEAVLMRMNAAPRSAAEKLGTLYKETVGVHGNRYSVREARSFLKTLTLGDWDRARPEDASLNGAGYQKVWEILSGEKI